MSSNKYIFSGTAPPLSPVVGQIWVDTNSGDLMMYTSASSWKKVAWSVSWYLFVDDLRDPSHVGWHSGEIVVARSSEDARVAVLGASQLPDQISFDHDLGGDDTAFKFMWFLINGHLDEKWDLRHVQQIIVHTANTVGRDKLVGLWTGFMKSIDHEMPIRIVKAKEANE